ncbi:MAG TPA: GNAT family N-acetyltransferase [Candidatus Kapabacteria bacterium]|nr:GNAT family N-acetyltransferase [Candidatus Kapabacteria bacterium]
MIRNLQPGDRAAIERMVRETGVFIEEEVAVAVELVDIALNDPKQEDYYFFVYDEGQGALGYVCLGPTPMTDGTFDLYWIAVAPEAQGKGIGQKLTARAEEFLVENDGRLMIVETSSKPSYDRTRKFYEDAGYVQLAEITNYYRLDDDLVIFGKYFR